MITDFENTVRNLIIKLIGEGDDSPYKVSEDRITIWKQKRDFEYKKFKGIVSEKRLIYYSDFYDLKTIINKNWELFLPVLNDKKRFEIFFEEMEKYRNTIAHGRTLTSSQEHLVKGITGDFKNSITIFHNRNEMKDDYFIQVTKVSDNLGNVWTNNGHNNAKPILRVGDEYELVVEANDPKDRRIEYKLSGGLRDIINSQDSNKLNLKIDKSLISKSLTFYITAFTPETDYENSDFIHISTTILPE